MHILIPHPSPQLPQSQTDRFDADVDDSDQLMVMKMAKWLQQWHILPHGARCKDYIRRSCLSLPFYSFIIIPVSHYHSPHSLSFSVAQFIVTHDHSLSLIIGHINRKTPSQIDVAPWCYMWMITGKVQNSDFRAAFHSCVVSVVYSATHWARSYRQSVPVWVVTIFGLPPTRVLVFAPQIPPRPVPTIRALHASRS